jgi:ParB-like chromosome segregation protein Spo0J
MVSMDKLDPDPAQLARHTPERLRWLAADLAANGLLQALGVVDHLEMLRIIWGHGRFAAAQMNGWKEIEAKVYPATTSETQVKVYRLLENIQQDPLTDQQFFLQVKELQALNPAWQRQDLGAVLHRSPSAITRILSVDDLIPAAREAFLGKAFGFSVAYEISKASSAQEQHELLAARLNHRASRDSIARRQRRARNGNGQPAARVGRINCAMPGGRTVSVSGEGLSLDEAIEAAQEWIKFARKAVERGWDAKTLERACAAEARNGR